MSIHFPQCDICDIPINKDDGGYCVTCNEDKEIAKGKQALVIQKRLDSLVLRLKKLGYTYENYNDRSSIRKERKNG